MPSADAVRAHGGTVWRVVFVEDRPSDPGTVRTFYREALVTASSKRSARLEARGLRGPDERIVSVYLEHERDFWEEAYQSLHSAEDLIAELRAENRELRLRLGGGTERLP